MIESCHITLFPSQVKHSSRWPPQLNEHSQHWHDYLFNVNLLLHRCQIWCFVFWSSTPTLFLNNIIASLKVIFLVLAVVVHAQVIFTHCVVNFQADKARTFGARVFCVGVMDFDPTQVRGASFYTFSLFISSNLDSVQLWGRHVCNWYSCLFEQ